MPTGVPVYRENGCKIKNTPCYECGKILHYKFDVYDWDGSFGSRCRKCYLKAVDSYCGPDIEEKLHGGTVING